MSQFFLDDEFLLERFPGKGGWTYAAIPQIEQNPNNPFGWVKVSGFIDQIELSHYKLMPMGKGRLFMPVKAVYRKKLNKEAGDTVRLRLNIENEEQRIPLEIKECLELESERVQSEFNKLSEGERKAFFDWIYASQNEDVKALRIAEMFTLLSKGIKAR